MATVYSNFTTPRTAPGSREAAAAQQARDVATYNTLASNPNVNFSGKKVSSRAEGGGTAQPLPTTPTTIPVTDLTKTETPVPIPKPVVAEPVYNLTDMTRDNASMGIGATTEMAPTTSQFETDMDVALRKRQEILGEAPSAEELFARREREMGIEQKQKTVNAYQTQLNQIVADAKARQLSVEGQGRGIPEVIIGGQQAQIAKEAAIQALPIQALLSAAQGDLTFAQNRLDTLARLEMQDAQLAYQNKKEMFSFAFDYATDQQKTRLAVAEKAADREWEREKNNIADRTEWGKWALSNGNTDVFKTIMALYPSSPDYSTQVSRAVGSMADTYTVSSEYQGILNTILGSGKFTKDQVSLIKASILRGDDPFAVIKNQAKNLMTSTNAGDVQKYEVARDTLSDIGTQLQEFYSVGGDTGLIKGNFEKVINNLGNVTDPALVTLATQIQGNLQVYRNAISGTAYSEQEGRDIRSIFPGIDKSQSLNTAILKGRSLLFDSVIDSNYRSVLGSTYDKLKNMEVGQMEQPVTEPPKTPSIEDQYNLWKTGGTCQTSTPTATTPVINKAEEARTEVQNISWSNVLPDFTFGLFNK
jgi:hypothetical protein